MGTPCTPYGDPTLITHRDLKKVNTLNKYNFPTFTYYKETIKKLVTMLIKHCGNILSYNI